MAEPIVNQAARRTPPGAGTATTVNTTSTAAVDLSAHLEEFVMFQAQGTSGEGIHIRFGDSDVGASTANDIQIPTGDAQEFVIIAGRTHFRAIGTAASLKLVYAVTGA
jgi:hypothetical protein